MRRIEVARTCFSRSAAFPRPWQRAADLKNRSALPAQKACDRGARFSPSRMLKKSICICLFQYKQPHILRCFENTPHPITPSPLPSPQGRGKRGEGSWGEGLRRVFPWFPGAAGGISDCHKHDAFAPRGTNNCGFFGPKNGPQNDSATDSYFGASRRSPTNPGAPRPPVLTTPVQTAGTRSRSCPTKPASCNPSRDGKPRRSAWSRPPVPAR